MTRTRLSALATVGIATLLYLGCGETDGQGQDPGDGGGDADTDTDTDTDADTDGQCASTADCSICTDPACISAIGGHVEDQDGNPMPGLIQICIPVCLTTPIDENGDFCLAFDTCTGFDFDDGGKLYTTIFQNSDTHTRYSVGLKPTQDDISDQGADDFVLDLGTLKQFELPAEGTEYTSSSGAVVDGLDGVSFDLDPGSLSCPDDADSCELKAMEFPLAEWTPPFVHDLPIDALYYLHPYLHTVDGGVSLAIDPTAAGWSASDTGTVWVLGDYTNYFVDCGGEDLPIGWLASCGAAGVQDGDIVTDPLPFLGFIGLVKD
jgi:hypothetical protein